MEEVLQGVSYNASSTKSSFLHHKLEHHGELFNFKLLELIKDTRDMNYILQVVRCSIKHPLLHHQLEYHGRFFT